MAGMLEYKCPCCDGAIQFDSATQKMKCPYCDTEFDVDTLKGYDEELKDEKPSEMEWTTPGGSWAEGETAGLHTYSCKSCGGEIVGDDKLDNWVTTLSGIFGLGVVLFPCKVSWYDESLRVGFFQVPMDISNIIHTICAAVFFILLAYNSISPPLTMDPPDGGDLWRLNYHISTQDTSWLMVEFIDSDDTEYDVILE